MTPSRRTFFCTVFYTVLSAARSGWRLLVAWGRDRLRFSHTTRSTRASHLKGGNESLGQLARFQTSLIDIANDLLQHDVSDAFYQKLLERAVDLLPNAHAGSVLLRQDDGMYHFVAAVDYDLGGLKALPLAPDELYFDNDHGRTSYLLTDLSGHNREALSGSRAEALEVSGHTSEIRATLVVPIRLAGETVAALCLDSKTSERAFDETAVGMAEALGSQLGVVLQRLRLQAEAARAAQELELLERVRAALAREEGLDEVLHAVTGAVAEIFGYPHVGVALIKGDLLAPHACVGHGGGLEPFPLSKGVAGRVARTGKPALVRDVRLEPDYLNFTPRPSASAVDDATAGDTTVNDTTVNNGPGGFELCVPLFDEGRVIGVINIETPPALPLGEADLKLMTALGEHIGTAVERARLYKEVSKSETNYRALYGSAQRQAQELALLERVRTELAKALEPQDIFRVVVEALADTFGYTQVSVYRLENETLILQHQVGYTRPVPRLPLTSGVMGRVARSGEPALIEDVRLEPAFVDATVVGEGVGVTSEICVPLLKWGEVAGVLNVESTGGVALTRADLGLVLSLSEHIAIALERARLYSEVREREAHFQDFLDSAHDLVWSTDLGGRFLYVNRAWRETLGYETLAYGEADASGVFDLLHPDYRESYRAAFARVTRGETVGVFDAVLLTKSGKPVSVQGSATCRFEDGQPVAVQSIFRDVTATKRAEARLLHSATHDALTNLPNRTLFSERLEQAVARASRDASQDPATHTNAAHASAYTDAHTDAHTHAPYAVLFLDLDRFKVINDSLGHCVGDALLVEVAKRLLNCVRAGDTVARLGGDEFAILLEPLRSTDSSSSSTHPSTDNAQSTAERIRRALEQPFSLGGREVTVTTSIGIAQGSARYTRAEDVLRDADLGMYRAKGAGRAQWRVFDASMHADALRLLQLETDLPHAASRGELFVAYQPIVSLQGEQLLGFEALLRWRHPEHGLISPGEFVPVAEETGAIVDMGRWVLREACKQLQAWEERAEPFNARHAPTILAPTINVNLSAKQLALPDLAREVAEVLEETGVAAGRLKLELTESALMEDGVTDTLHNLRALGVHIQIDDFGTGYSSLSYLHRFPIDSLKIDRSFVSRIGEDEVSGAIITTIISLARALDIAIIAEGVETVKQLEWLRNLGCEAGQGYLFAKPLLPEAVQERFFGAATTVAA